MKKRVNLLILALFPAMALATNYTVTASNTVTVYVCGTGTPASLAYNVTVVQP